MVIKTNIPIKSNVLSSLKKTSISLVRISLSIHAFFFRNAQSFPLTINFSINFEGRLEILSAGECEPAKAASKYNYKINKHRFH
jgi:hypothetical protein